MNDERKKKPAFSLRVGKIKATAWKNTSGESTFMSYKLTRSYRDKEGNWTDSDSYGVEDLPVIAALVQEIERRHFASGNVDTADSNEVA